MGYSPPGIKYLSLNWWVYRILSINSITYLGMTCSPQQSAGFPPKKVVLWVKKWGLFEAGWWNIQKTATQKVLGLLGILDNLIVCNKNILLVFCCCCQVSWHVSSWFEVFSRRRWHDMRWLAKKNKWKCWVVERNEKTMINRNPLVYVQPSNLTYSILKLMVSYNCLVILSTHVRIWGCKGTEILKSYPLADERWSYLLWKSWSTGTMR